MSAGRPYRANADRHASYTGDRDDLLSLLPSDVTGAALDVGCSTGALGRRLKERSGGRIEVTGIELEPEYATEASINLDECFNTDAAAGLEQLRTQGRRFDVVVLADILEHLEDPWSAFDMAVEMVRPGGHVLLSLPNVAHWTTFASLLGGRWPRRSRGIHDATHLRFFARRDVEELMNRGSAVLAGYRRVYRVTERPVGINRAAGLIAWVLPDLFTYQFLAVSRVTGSPDGRRIRIRPFVGAHEPASRDPRD